MRDKEIKRVQWGELCTKFVFTMKWSWPTLCIVVVVTIALFVCLFYLSSKHIVIHDIKNTDVSQYTNRHSLRLYNYYHRNFWTLTCNTSQYIHHTIYILHCF